MIAQTTATASRMIRPTGMSPILTMFLYQPPSALACGKFTDCVYVNTDASPLEIFMLAIEVMNDGTFQYATR